MGQARKITLAVINIALHAPHIHNMYIDLIRAAFRRRSIVRMGALHGAMLGSLYRPVEQGRNAYLSGEIYRFVKLDVDEPWFNSETKEPATDDEVDAISIPAHLLPHLQVIPFVFNVRRHLLWYVSKDRRNAFSPRLAQKFLESILNETIVEYGFPEVSVTAVPESSSVDEILNLPGLEYLRIELVRPNPDDVDDADARWLAKLASQNVTKVKLELSHAKNAVVEPDEETREMAKVAASNGSVYGRGRGADGLPVEDSTRDRPKLIHEYIDSEIETVANLLLRSAE